VGGNSVGFRDLARLVGEDQPFYGVQAQGLDGQVPCLKRVEDMAARYLQEICIVQPKGPYFLGGFSFGGWVAYEMALQLHARGQEVGLVALLDTYPFRLQPITSSLLSFLRVPTQQQLMHVLPKTVKKGIRRRIVWLQLPRGIKNVHRACYEAERHYQLGPYPGRVTLFRATESLTTSSDPHARWRDLATGGLEIQEVPGHHGDIIVEPQVRILAEKLRDSLERAQREQAESSWQTLSSKI
jgi:thioesterase domain-containing protein